jgi:hypothetical protein
MKLLVILRLTSDIEQSRHASPSTETQKCISEFGYFFMILP